MARLVLRDNYYPIQKLKKKAKWENWTDQLICSIHLETHVLRLLMWRIFLTCMNCVL